MLPKLFDVTSLPSTAYLQGSEKSSSIKQKETCLSLFEFPLPQTPARSGEGDHGMKLRLGYYLAHYTISPFTKTLS